MNDHDIQGPPAEAACWPKSYRGWRKRAKRPARRPTVFTVSEVRHLPAFQPDPEAVKFALRGARGQALCA